MRRVTVDHIAIVAALLFAAGCGFKNAGTSSGVAGSNGRGGSTGSGGAAGTVGGSGGGGIGGGGRGGTGGPPFVIDLDGGIVRDGAMSSPDLNCGAITKTSSKLPPDILIVLDRSGSMNESYNGTSCGAGGTGGRPGGGTNCGADSKWAKVVPAITQVVSETDTEVNWGLKFFPESMGGAGMDACAVSNNADVTVGPSKGAAIQTAIMGSTQANGGVATGYNGTPTRNAANGAAGYLQTLTDTNPKFILLATDGVPTCPEPGVTDASPGAIAAVQAAKTAGYSTFVVGIATANSAAADATLSGMATAGGLARAATPTYYPVTNADDLAAAIRTLVGVAATCSFQVGPTPTSDGTTSLDKIDVFGDGVPIQRDMTHANGYDYKDASMQQIEVHGPLCDQIKSGAIKDVTVTFRCIIL
jgi:hypothetical protein